MATGGGGITHRSPPLCDPDTNVVATSLSSTVCSVYPGSSHSGDSALPHHNDGIEGMGENVGMFFSRDSLGNGPPRRGQ
jgi:hypothetical protein